LASGQLVRVLVGWTRPGMPVSLAATGPTTASARQKVVIDHLSAAIKRALAV